MSQGEVLTRGVERRSHLGNCQEAHMEDQKWLGGARLDLVVLNSGRPLGISWNIILKTSTLYACYQSESPRGWLCTLLGRFTAVISSCFILTVPLTRFQYSLG